MKLPNRNRNWLKEIQTAYTKAERDVVRDDVDVKRIYVYAVKYAAKNRGIKDKGLISEIVKHAVDAVKLELQNDPDTENNCRFNFVSTYIYSHYYADLLNEIECDKIMDYVNREWDLFENSE